MQPTLSIRLLPSLLKSLTSFAGSLLLKVTVFQVHNSVAAEINASSIILQDEVLFSDTQHGVPEPAPRTMDTQYTQGAHRLGGTTRRTMQEGQDMQDTETLILPGPPLFRVLLPATLPGMRCYTDASTAPDNPLQITRQAGLGVFIIDTSTQQTTAFFIKAKLQATPSVLMAEAAALSLAAHVVSNLQINRPFFLTDNQQLVNFFNGNDHANPPRWEIKNYTQQFINHTATNNAKSFQGA